MDGEARIGVGGRCILAALVICGLGAAGAGPAAAQIANPDAAATAMAGNYAAMARGYAALAWNPALLALVDGPTYSVSVLAPTVGFGMNPVSAPVLVRNVDRTVPLSTRQTWLNAIQDKGGESGVANGGLTYLAFSTGSFGLQISTQASGVVNMSPELARLALTGRLPGGATTAQLNGRLDAAVTSSVAAAYAAHFPVDLARYPTAELTLGLTVHYTVGHFLATGLPEPQLQGPNAGQPGFMVMQTDSGLAAGANGHGLGIDVGAAFRNGRLALSLAVHNLFDNFSWTSANLVARPVSALFGASLNGSLPVPFTDAPADLQKRVIDLKFQRAVELGATYQVSRRLLLSADARAQGAGGMDFSATSRLGVGAQYMLLPKLPVRVGVTGRSDGYVLGAGLGYNLDGFGAALSGGLRHTNLGSGSVASLTLSYVGMR